MELLIIWILTIITSFGMKFIQELRIFKDIADLGYKVDLNELSEVDKELNKSHHNMLNVAFLELLIPIYNMVSVLERTIQYSSNKAYFLEQLKFMDCIERMSRFEYGEYQKKSTGLNAVVIPIICEKRLKNAKVLKIISNNDISLIYYEVGNNLDDITILKTTCLANFLTLDRQKEKVKEAWIDLSFSTNKASNSKDSFLNQTLTNSKDIDIIINDALVKDKISSLEKLKEQLNSNLHSDKEKVKIKKLK